MMDQKKSDCFRKSSGSFTLFLGQFYDFLGVGARSIRKYLTKTYKSMAIREQALHQKQNHIGDDLFENAKKDRSLFGGSFDYVDTFESFNKDNNHD